MLFSPSTTSGIISLTVSSSGAVGTAAQTVNASPAFLLTATGSGLAITFPSPTGAYAPGGKAIFVAVASGSPVINIHGRDVQPGSYVILFWDGIAFHHANQPPSTMDQYMVPAVQFELESDGASSGMSADVHTLNSNQVVKVKYNDIPEWYLSAAQPRLELLRWRSKAHRREVGTGIRRSRTGWFHPSHWDGSSGIAHVFGTRGGRPAAFTSLSYSGTPGARPTEWDMSGLTHANTLRLKVADIFGGWFRLTRLNAPTLGIDAFTYMDGKSYSRLGNVLASQKRQVNRATNIGKFAFRYSILDPISGRRVTGPETRALFVGIAVPLFAPSATTPGQWELRPGADWASGSANAIVLRAGFDKRLR